QAFATNGTHSVKLIDPERIAESPHASVPDDVQKSLSSGLIYFPTLPPHLRSRFWYDPNTFKLRFKGQLIEPAAGEYYLLLNVISKRDQDRLLALSANPTFK